MSTHPISPSPKILRFPKTKPENGNAEQEDFLLCMSAMFAAMRLSNPALVSITFQNSGMRKPFIRIKENAQ